MEAQRKLLVEIQVHCPRRRELKKIGVKSIKIQVHSNCYSAFGMCSLIEKQQFVLLLLCGDDD